ncbi:MAG: CHAD domain-containing protein [Deltaproteobacteria bacterium]
MSNIEYFVIDDEAGFNTVLGQLKSNYKLRKEGTHTKEENYFDTFDYKIYKNGLLLAREGSRYALIKAQGNDTVDSVIIKTKKKPKFWWDFADSSFREKLRSCIDVRALLPLTSVERLISRYRLLNKDDKTVLFLGHEEIRLTEGGHENKAANMIYIEPVRGYVEELERMKQYLDRPGLEKTDLNLLSLALELAGRTPGEYSSKINVKLEPDMSSSEAVRKILFSLLDTIKVNVDGIVEDIDIEFLHDFRVAVRRTRSVLTLIKGVFQKRIQTRYKRDFAGLGKKTNLLRDLDIYLLKKDEYLEMLPAELRPGLDRLFAIIRKERQQAHREFVEYINSPACRNVLQSWEKFLNEPHETDGPSKNAAMPVIELADKHIRKRYKKVLKLGNKINDDSPESDLHTLRIECKKLRYFLEFFESLFPEREIRQTVKQLKGLQDNLGDYNDLHVQQETLKGYIAGLDSGTDSERDIIASAGGLISQLYRRQKGIRAAFKKRFEEFSNEETDALFEKLFSGH